MISRKKAASEKRQLKAIEILKLTLNYKITGQSLQPFEWHRKALKYLKILLQGDLTPPEEHLKIFKFIEKSHE